MTIPDIHPDERIDEINEYISLIQKKNGLTLQPMHICSLRLFRGTTNAAPISEAARVSFLFWCAQKNKAGTVYAVELQEEFARLIERNAALNSLSDRVIPVCADIRNIDRSTTGGALDAVFANPPYMKKGAGLPSASEVMHCARYEENGTFSDFAKCAAGLLKKGGSFYTVHRADRIADVIGGMRSAGIEPKRLVTVYPTEKVRRTSFSARESTAEARGCESLPLL